MPHREPTSETTAPASLAERLTDDFYRWELRGRGWHIFPYTVELEPPYRPFFFRSLLVRAGVADDARRPTSPSSFVGGLLGLLRDTAATPAPEPPENDFVEPEAEPFDADAFGPLVTIATA